MSCNHCAFIAAGIVLASGLAFADSETQSPRSQKTPDLPSAEEQIVSGTNQFRRRHLRHAVTVNTELSKAARYFAQFLAKKDELSHTADGQEPWDRAKKFGYQYCVVEENIAMEFNSEGFTTDQLAQALVKGWEQSPGHRKNMLNQNVTETGVAVARSEASGKYYAVQMFGRPQALEMSFEIVNDAASAVKYKLDDQPYTIQPRVRMLHRACIPPELKFLTEGQETYHPENGSRFVIQGDSSGKMKIATMK
jgi:uncharacterized protein YkwD